MIVRCYNRVLYYLLSHRLLPIAPIMMPPCACFVGYAFLVCNCLAGILKALLRRKSPTVIRPRLFLRRLAALPISDRVGCAVSGGSNLIPPETSRPFAVPAAPLAFGISSSIRPSCSSASIWKRCADDERCLG